MKLRDVPPIDPRAREDVFNEMRKSLKNKGIHIDENDGEILSALAVLYSNMLEGTIQRLNRTPEKHRIAFLNMVHTPPRPAWPSSGIVAFEVVNGYDNPVTIPKGARVVADNDGNPISFRLRSDLTAVPANITDIYWCDPDSGRYGYARDLSRFIPWNPEDTQETIYKADFIFKNIFYHDNEAALLMEASLRTRPVRTSDLVRATRWSMSPWPAEEDGIPEMPVSVSEKPDGRLYLRIKGPIPDAGHVRVRMELTDPLYSELVINDMYLTQLSGSAPPDSVLTNARGLDSSSFYPFGRPMRTFEECGIFCDAALSQRSAEITICFELRLELSEEWPPEQEEAIDYKWIMRKPLPKPEPVVYDALAKSVRLEYWDGSTYREIRDASGRVLDFTRGNPRVELTFARPDDIEVCEYYGVRGYYLRLSCYECDELYKLPRRVYTPHISDFRFLYRHTEKYYPLRVETDSFGRLGGAALGDHGQIVLFDCPRKSKTLLFGFDRLAWKFHMKMYVNIENSRELKIKSRRMHASMYSEGEERSLVIHDMTGALSSSGSLRFEVPENLQPSVLFGKERYWLAISVSPEACPIISGIYLNAVLAENKIRYEENFSYSHLRGNRITLAHGNVIWANVKVRSLTGDSMEQWREYKASDGKLRSGFYMIDYISGLITFPNDIISRSITDDMLDLISVTYDATNGDDANLAANSITRTEEDMPFIQSVRNPVDIVNGAVGESGEELADRKRHALYNGGRVVSKRDFELFAINNCPLVSDAKCAYDPANKAVLLAVRIKKDEQRSAFTRVKSDLRGIFTPLIQEGTRLEILPWEDFPC